MGDQGAGRYFVPILVALVTGVAAATPGILSFFNTPLKISAEFRKLQEESELKLQLQRDEIVAKFLTRLDDPQLHIRSGAALSLSAFGEDNVIPILAGKLQEAVEESNSSRKTAGKSEVADPEKEQQFVVALEQSLIALGVPSLRYLLDLDRDYIAQSKQDVILGLTPSRGDITAELRFGRRLAEVIRSILFKVSNFSVAPKGTQSPLVKKNIALSYADLRQVLLSDINLSGVDFSFALLYQASFYGADLTGSRFEGAYLPEVRFTKGIFDKANFRNAIIRKPFDFQQASFHGADFAGAKINDEEFKRYLIKQKAINVH